MATEAIAARDAKDPRWFILLMNLSLRTGLAPEDCEGHIADLAK